jgi:tripartite ATP-independent transporter DctM subunit
MACCRPGAATREPWMGFRELWKSFQGAVWALIMTAMILFGILSGWFTPTEAAVVSVLYAFVIGIYVYKGFTIRDVPRLIADSAIAGAGLLVLVGFANVFGWILTSERIPQYISAWLLAVTDNKYLIILFINILLLIVGCFMETIAALIILTPPLLAVATAVGIDPVQFATFAILNLILGLTTPPVGVCLFICANIAKISLVEISVAIWPFLLTNIAVLMLVSYVPWISLLLPTLFFR